MSNLTLSIDAETLKRARLRALDQGTSVNAVVRRFLEDYAGREDRRRAIDDLIRLGSGSGGVGSTASGRNWRREDLYEERTRWPRS